MTNERRKELYHQRKAAGLCVRCGDPAREGKTKCEFCSGKDRYRMKLNREKMTPEQKDKLRIYRKEWAVRNKDKVAMYSKRQYKKNMLDE